MNFSFDILLTLLWTCIHSLKNPVTHSQFQYLSIVYLSIKKSLSMGKSLSKMKKKKRGKMKNFCLIIVLYHTHIPKKKGLKSCLFDYIFFCPKQLHFYVTNLTLTEFFLKNVGEYERKRITIKCTHTPMKCAHILI